MKLQKTIICITLMAVLSSLPAFAEKKVLVLAGNISQAEFVVLEKFDQVGNEKITYEQSKDRALPNLNSADILWIGQGEICEGAYFFTQPTEDKILAFAEAGGVVISIGQDSDDGRPCEVGWLPVEVTGIERPGVDVFEITNAKEVGDLFTKPNKIELNGAHFDDAWTKPDKSIILLATIAGGQDVGVGLIRHGLGAYLLTSLENENAADVTINTLIMENIIHYAVNLIETQAVEAQGKLPIIWGQLKSR